MTMTQDDDNDEDNDYFRNTRTAAITDDSGIRLRNMTRTDSDFSEYDFAPRGLTEVIEAMKVGSSALWSLAICRRTASNVSSTSTRLSASQWSRASRLYQIGVIP